MELVRAYKKKLRLNYSPSYRNHPHLYQWRGYLLCLPRQQQYCHPPFSLAFKIACCWILSYDVAGQDPQIVHIVYSATHQLLQLNFHTWTTFIIAKQINYEKKRLSPHQISANSDVNHPLLVWAIKRATVTPSYRSQLRRATSILEPFARCNRIQRVS